MTFIKAWTRLNGTSLLRQCQPRNKYLETFYTLFTFPYVHDLPGTRTAELIYAPSVPLRSPATERYERTLSTRARIEKKEKHNERTSEQLMLVSRRCESIEWDPKAQRSCLRSSSEILGRDNGRGKNWRRKFACCRRGTIILRVVSLDNLWVTRLSLEWRAIWFEYFWRVLCQFLTMGLCVESEFSC